MRARDALWRLAAPGSSTLSGQERRPGRGGAGGRFALLVALVLPLPGCGAPREAAPLGRIAFLRGDTLYVQALPGGKPRLLLTGGAFSQPRWSPSGGWLAVRARDGLRVTRANGTGGQKLAGPEAGDFAWAPTDDRLAFVAEGNLIVARPGGLGVVLVEKAPGAAVEGLAWSEDGQRIAYVVVPAKATAAPTRLASSGDAFVRVVPSRGGPSAGVESSPVGAAPLVRGWSGDGRLLVLFAGVAARGSGDGATRALYAVPVGQAHGAARLLADSVTALPGSVAPQPAGAAVAIIRGGPPGRPDVQLVLAGSGTAAPAPLSAPGHAPSSPAWSPAGERIAWVEAPEASFAGAASADRPPARVMVAEVDPAGRAASPRAFGRLSGRQAYPRWAADARHLVIVTVDADARASIWLVAEGESNRQVAVGLRPPRAAMEFGGSEGRTSWDTLLDYWPGARLARRR